MGIVDFWAAVDFDQPPFIHPADCAVLDRARPRLAAGGYLHLALLPEPFSGDLGTADIYILNANPGYGGSEYNEQYGNLAFRERLIGTIRQNFDGVEHPHVYFDPRHEGCAGYRWWTRHLRGVGSHNVLAKRVATLDLFPYHSKGFEYGYATAQLPSALAIKHYVHQELVPRARRGEIVLIVCRQRDNWGFNEADDDGRNLIIYSSTHARGAWMTPPTRGGQAIMQRLGISTGRTASSVLMSAWDQPIEQSESHATTGQQACPPSEDDMCDEHETEGPPASIVDGRLLFYLDNHSWAATNITAAQLELAAQNRMGMSGPDAIAALVEAVEHLGPRIGSEIIQVGLNRESTGPGAQYWTVLFRYAWRHHGILRYMSNQNGTGRSRYCTIAQALAHRAA